MSSILTCASEADSNVPVAYLLLKVLEVDSLTKTWTNILLMLLIYRERPFTAWCDAFDSELNIPRLWLPDTLEDILSEIKSWIRSAGEITCNSRKREEGGAVSKFIASPILMDIDASEESGVAKPWRLVSQKLRSKEVLRRRVIDTSSYVSNSAVPDLEKRAKEFIPEELSYSCWMTQTLPFRPFLTKEIEARKQFLIWLEAAALMKGLSASVVSFVYHRWVSQGMCTLVMLPRMPCALFEPWGLYLTQHSTFILVRSAVCSNQVEDL
ncbi:hypothetical protein BDR04DRAFT_1155634 [Suillus decipiens]|nr:hypothetical protein BDR04DRAFT_1155634 [Suillus decipiens]